MFGLLLKVARFVLKTGLKKSVQKAKSALSLNAFKNAKKNFVLKLLATRYLGPMNSFVQPLTRVSFTGSSRFRKAFGGKGFFVSKGNVKASKTVFVGGDSWFSTGKGWEFKSGSFMKWYAKEVGINVAIDQMVDYRKHKNKALKVQKRFEQLKNLPLRKRKSELKRMNAQESNFNPKTQTSRGKTALDDLYNGIEPNGANSTKTSFPKSPMSWLSSGSFYRQYNTMLLTPTRGNPFPVHSNENGFNKMARSIHPGKVLWDGPWFFKRTTSLKNTNVIRRAKRKGLL